MTIGQDFRAIPEWPEAVPMPHLGDDTVLRLRKARLRPTRQRRELADLMFRDEGETFTAEELHARAIRRGIKVSLATVYGTLHRFRDIGLLRELSIDSKLYFDANPNNHQYFYYEEERRLVGISDAPAGFGEMPSPPEGRSVTRVDVVVRLRRS